MMNIKNFEELILYGFQLFFFQRSFLLEWEFDL